MEPFRSDLDYQCWLRYEQVASVSKRQNYQDWCKNLVIPVTTQALNSAREELVYALNRINSLEPVVSTAALHSKFVILGRYGDSPLIDQACAPDEIKPLHDEGYIIKTLSQQGKEYIVITSRTDRGALYGCYHFLRLLQTGQDLSNLEVREEPVNTLRLLNHWDNLDGSVERGYAGDSLFYRNYGLTPDLTRIRDYARLLASIGINGIVVNNVNVYEEETRLISDRLPLVKTLAEIFRAYGIRVFLSINFAAPIQLAGLATADPLATEVKAWWRQKAAEIYREIPDFGGFLVKADSESRPGPFTYHRTQAEGANMLAEAVKDFGGLVLWRCFVYNCQQDWRDTSTDRAKAAYDHFKPLDGQFAENVVLQIKNGPMDFQVREPVSPLLGGMEETNQLLELQITQEYTGQQIHLCYLVPQWKEVLEFDTYARGPDSFVKKVVDGSLFQKKLTGIAGVANIGSAPNWTGHSLAQANLFGFGRLAWNPHLPVEEITEEWVRLTFGSEQVVVATICRMLMSSWRIYENYTAPLGIGWMVNPGHHYGPNVDGYEYSRWGTYHRADHTGIGIDRTVRTGTGFAGQYHPENVMRFETPQTCPEELLLFFHHLPYTYRLQNGKTIIQHIYDTHFDGVEQAKGLKESWESLRDYLDEERFTAVLDRLKLQIEHAKEWRDVINTYFYRKTGIPDQRGRKIYP
ncbi:MAG TPA: alpha-glucuronidase [Firmicutes bacterium]|nr:alpha-glucuronidase [Bacillota bacterium]